jgi:hypothetical protein
MLTIWTSSHTLLDRCFFPFVACSGPLVESTAALLYGFTL